MRAVLRPGIRLAVLLALPGCVDLPGSHAVDGFVHLPARSWDGTPAPATATVPAILDNNRMFVTVVFRRPDGRERTALAWVNMGMGGISLAPGLRDELGQGRPVSFTIGGVPVVVDPGGVLPASADDFAQQLGPMPVEAILPAGVLRQFRVTLDYGGPRLTLEPPCDAPAPGVAVPIRVSEATGLISTDVSIDGQRYPVVIDSGGGYSWWRGDVVRGLLASHPERLRAEGAVGQSNQAMVDRAFELQGTVVRVPVVALGKLQLRDVGLLGSGPPQGGVIGRIFWRAWSKGAPEPVVGWLGGNVLRDYRVTIDYRNHLAYWLQTAAPGANDLHSVGISLVHTTTDYRVGGLVRPASSALADIKAGDRLVAIDGRDAASMTRGGILDALHGDPGEHRRLTLDRDGHSIEADTVVGAY